MDYFMAIVWVCAVLLLVLWQAKNNMVLKLELKQSRDMKLRKIEIEKLEKPVCAVLNEVIKDHENLILEGIAQCEILMDSEIKGEPLYDFA